VNRRMSNMPFVHYGNNSSSVYRLKCFAVGVLVVIGCYQFGVLAVLRAVIIPIVLLLTDVILYRVLNIHFLWERSVYRGLLIVACIPPATPLLLTLLVMLSIHVLTQWTFTSEHQPICDVSITTLLVLYAFFPNILQNSYVTPSYWFFDVATSATPLAERFFLGTSAEITEIPSWIGLFIQNAQATFAQFAFLAIPEQLVIHLFGVTAGTIAEQYSLLVLAVSIILFVYTGTHTVPVMLGLLSFVAPIYAFDGLSSGLGLFQGDILHHVLNGGYLFALLFFVGDPTITSKNLRGNILFGCLFGSLAALFRLFGSTSDGTIFALFLPALLVPLWDYYVFLNTRKKYGKWELT